MTTEPKYEFHRVSTSPTLWRCSSCGAVVSTTYGHDGRDDHARWHANIHTTIGVLTAAVLRQDQAAILEVLESLLQPD